MPFCNQCGHENPAGSRFCSNCGTPMRDEQPSDQTATISAISLSTQEGDQDRGESVLPADGPDAVEALPPGSALLIVQRGPSAGSKFLLDTDLVTAGRHPDSEIFLDDVTVSRRHAEFVRSSAGYTVRDVGSLNGSYVNRDRIDEIDLTNGDEVQIGKFRLMYYASHRGFRPATGMAVPDGPEEPGT